MAKPDRHFVNVFSAVIGVLVAWVAIVAVEYARGVRPDLIQYGSRIALIPIWFLAVYIVIVLLAPVMEALWARRCYATSGAKILLDVSAENFERAREVLASGEFADAVVERILRHMKGVAGPVAPPSAGATGARRHRRTRGCHRDTRSLRQHPELSGPPGGEDHCRGYFPAATRHGRLPARNATL